MKELFGEPSGIKNSILGKLYLKNDLFAKDKILYCKKKPLFKFGVKAFVVPESKEFKTSLPLIKKKTNCLLTKATY